MSAEAAGYITDVSYVDHYYEHLSPITLNYVAGLNGQLPRNLDDFDYCELGCGAGLSLLIHAACFPGGRFVGIDLNAAHIEHARRRAAAAGLENLTLIAEPVSDELAGSDLPQFDFIVMHGLYAWVSPEIRACIRRFIAARLKPGGRVLLSYNAMPGCASRHPLRDIMRRFALPLSQDSMERVQLGLSYLRLMLNAQVPFFRLNPETAKYAESLFERDPRYIAHEFFNEHWHPLSVENVADELAESKLAFVGTLPLWQNHKEADIPENLAGLFTDDTPRIVRETHKDFIYNTVFRIDLFGDCRFPESAADRAQAFWETPFCAVTPPDKVEFAVQKGALKLPLNTRDSRTIFGLLCEQPRSPAELAGNPRLATMSRAALTDALCWWVLSGQVRPCLPHRPDAERVRRLNAVLLEAALHDPAQSQATFASPLLGTGIGFPKSEALAVHAMTAASDRTPAESLCSTMQQIGLSVEEDGVAMDEQSLADLATQLYDELEASGNLERARLVGLIP